MATIGLDRLYYAKITEDTNGDETYGAPQILAKPNHTADDQNNHSTSDSGTHNDNHRASDATNNWGTNQLSSHATTTQPKSQHKQIEEKFNNLLNSYFLDIFQHNLIVLLETFELIYLL